MENILESIPNIIDLMTLCDRVNRKGHLSILDEILSKLDTFVMPIKPENVISLVAEVI